ncbi:MAG: hypothetical protein KJ601_01775 [Nanoarchaeota archaeon]|nr:hypothetical protein [Nanoarchaeota archaeon]MBU1703959.1 hypothetical protein [Nanoarchaeota archaeon]
MKKDITYFEKPGEENTEETLKLAVQYAKANNIKTIVIGSARGVSALKLKDMAPDLEIIDVAYSPGVSYKETLAEFEKNKTKIEQAGIKIIQCTHAFSGIDKCIFKKYGTLTPNVLISETLKLISEGTKVAVECALMAVDTGALRQKQPILALGGTHQGVDTCLLVEPSSTSNFFDLGILEIICMPRYGGLVH